MRRGLLVIVLLLVLAPPAQALDGATLRTVFTSALRSTSPSTGVYVRDLDTGRALFASKPDVARIPASVEKLYTTSTALLRFGPDATFRTTVVGQGALDEVGVWRGDLYLRGGGDPTLSPDGLKTLAAGLAEVGLRRVDGSILGDGSRFDALPGSSRTGGRYDADMGGVLGGLTVGRGFSRSGGPAADAARRLAKTLRAASIAVDGRTSTGTAPEGVRELAAVDSPPMKTLIGLTNTPSDNFLAESLLKDLGAAYRDAGTTSAGAAVVREQLATFGVHPRVVDGSGLSRADRTTPRQIVRLLERMHGQEVAQAFEGSLPVAGRTGTLRRRMRGTAAQDRCHAKTGTIRAVSTLAGLCQAAGGHTIAFAMMMNGANIARAHRAQDRMTATIARYDGV
jgi:serine-type D-Ala-D-Ala carboxypeptidase/endopeptidase (penicillin-binding protein 4)